MPVPDPEIGIESCFVVEAVVGGGCPGAGGTSGCFSETIGNCMRFKTKKSKKIIDDNYTWNSKFMSCKSGFANRRGFRGDWTLRVRNRHYCCSNHDHLWFKKPIGGNITEEQEGGVNGEERAAAPMEQEGGVNGRDRAATLMDLLAMALNRSKGEPVR
ncbi:hypothetical protein L2E82_00055 [Cichorium intybus]|uniref:Uncharacterized protein n=1 Tax=Cichorium intybus TaxID=13427 RepID=A0ACB9GX86_CICIN|nr:hypothetical protein L2E82_00055 [Cichorium intybus]